METVYKLEYINSNLVVCLIDLNLNGLCTAESERFASVISYHAIISLTKWVIALMWGW